MMPQDSRCRIGRIRFKSGGEMRVLETKRRGNPDIVDMLVSLLDRARDGKLAAFAMVSVTPDGTVGTAWCEGSGPYHHHIASGAATLLCRIGSS